MWGFVAIVLLTCDSWVCLVVMFRTWFVWLNEMFSMLSVDAMCLMEFWASVFRGVSHLYWSRVYFGGAVEAEACGRFVLDLGMNEDLVLNGDQPSPTLSATSSRMCPLSVLSLDFTRGFPSLFLICLSWPWIFRCSLSFGMYSVGTLALNFTVLGIFLAFCFKREIACMEEKVQMRRWLSCSGFSLLMSIADIGVSFISSSWCRRMAAKM